MCKGVSQRNHRDLKRDVLDGGRLDMRRQKIEGGAVLAKLFRPLAGEVAQRDALFLGTADGLVVNIGDIANMAHLHAVELEHAAEDILQEKCAEVADMRGTIDRGTAAIHAVRSIRLAGGEGFDGAAECVVKTNGHVAVEKRRGRRRETIGARQASAEKKRQGIRNDLQPRMNTAWEI